MGKRRKEENIYDYTGAVDVEAMREDRVEQPTEFTAPEKDQKWRARELFGFMWRHLGIGIAPGFRDIMLFLIEKANANTGRVWRQNKIAKVMKLSRDYISEGIQWWATQTPYLKAQRRQTRTDGLSATPITFSGGLLTWLGKLSMRSPCPQPMRSLCPHPMRRMSPQQETQRVSAK